MTPSKYLLIALAGVAAAWASASPVTVRAQAAAGAEQPAREPLNSERIEAKFGSYGVEVLESGDRLRVSNLYSDDGGRRICRTFAVVRYPTEIEPAYAAEHRLIAAGGSIGATFVAHGWTVDKTHRYFGLLPSGAGVDRLMGGVGNVELAVHVYRLDVVKGGRSLPYATIAEVHHPDYLRLDELERIYAGGRRPPTEIDAATAELLELTAERMAASTLLE